MADWVGTQDAWLTVERLPAYAPELNPVEGLWATLKAVELANFAGDEVAEVAEVADAAEVAEAAEVADAAEVAEVADAAEQGIGRVCHSQQLVWSFLAHTGLTLDYEMPHNL